MKNPYTMSLVCVMGLLLLIGILLTISHNFWGFAFLIVAVAMAIGGFMVTKASPREKGVVEVLGKKKPYTVEGPTWRLVLGKVKILDVVLIPMRQVTYEFKCLKDIRCNDGVIISGEGSISIKPGEAAEKLIQFDDMGQMEDVEKQVDGMVLAWTKKIAKGRDSIWMSTETDELATMIFTGITGGTVNGVDNGTLEDITGLGIDVEKLQMNLHRPPNLVKADEEVAESEIMEKVIRKRMVAAGVSFIEARKQLLEEEVVNTGKKQIIEAGSLVTFAPVSK